MKQITLTKDQLEAIKGKLNDADGEFYVEIEFEEFDGLMVQAEGWRYIYGYVEASTDAYVVTSKEAFVELTGWQMNHVTEEDEEVEINPENVKEIDEYLNAA
jgi:hypothetical protein